MKNFIWNYQEKSIRGSFVNLVVTFTILALVIVGAFSENVRENLEELTTLIIGFFTVSFGVWKAGNIFNGNTNNIKEH